MNRCAPRWKTFSSAGDHHEVERIGDAEALRLRTVRQRLQGSPRHGAARDPYETVPVDLFAGETLTDEYLARNPAARTPVLELDSGECLPESNTVADLCLYAYAHKAPQAGIGMEGYPAVAAWLARVEATPGFVNDLEPYPPNAMAGAGESVHG